MPKTNDIATIIFPYIIDWDRCEWSYRGQSKGPYKPCGKKCDCYMQALIAAGEVVSFLKDTENDRR